MGNEELCSLDNMLYYGLPIWLVSQYRTNSRTWVLEEKETSIYLHSS